MAKAKAYVVTRLDGQRASEHRGVAFLCCDSDEAIDASDVFSALSEKIQRDLRNRIDFWIGGGAHDKYFHGWPGHPDYSECFCFKWKEGRTRHRLYGSLSNPQPKTRPAFRLCTLMYHGAKNQEHTDTSILDRINRLRVDAAVKLAIANEYPDAEKAEKKWLKN